MSRGPGHVFIIHGNLLDLACDAVYSFLSGQAGASSTNPSAINNAVTGYAANKLWQVVDGPWHLTAFSAAGMVTMKRNPQYSGPRASSVAKFVEVPFTSAAAEQHEAGNHEKAAHHSQVAHGHQTDAAHHAGEAAKHHASEHGDK